MNIDTLLTHLKQMPFEPFRVSTSDGKELEVRHPDYALVTPGKNTVFIFTSPERFQIVDTKHITRIEPLGSAAHP